MSLQRHVFLLISLLALALPGVAATRTQVSLVLEAGAVKPGEIVTAGVLLKMPKSWHTYWRYGGDSGGPTRIEWELPAGITAGGIQWPVPEKYSMAGLTTYVYHDEVMLMVPLSVSADVQAGRHEIRAQVSWLECAEQCIPGKGKVQTAIEVGSTRAPSAEAPLFETWRQRLPRTDPALVVSAVWGAVSNETRAVFIDSPLKDARDFFPYGGNDWDVLGQTESTPSAEGVRLRKEVKSVAGAWPANLDGLLVAGAADSVSAYEVSIPVSEAGGNLAQGRTTAGNGSAGDPGSSAVGSVSIPRLLTMLLYAFLGGLILNIMPCVLPVIALKILGFVNQSRESPAKVRQHGWFYALGVLVSFLVLAGVVIAVQSAGRKAGWGLAFGSPIFVVAMTTLVTLVALNLFGVFEVFLSGHVMGAAGDLAGRGGGAGAFFNGVLATLLATPCTAPFLSLAVGFAFSQSPVVILAVFLTVGAGLAFPYVVLSWNPGWLRFLPKPGAWMEKFKMAMGFPMLATAVWLFTLAIEHYGDGLWLGFFLVVLSMAAWVFGEFIQRGRGRKGLAAVVATALLLVGYGYGLENRLQWRTPPVAPAHAGDGVIQKNPGGIEWRRWSPEAVARARAEGRPVLVDFTAKWCLTCRVNETTSIDIPSVRAKLKEINAVTLLADYTRFPPDITDELQRFGRAAVPLVLVYPSDSQAPPIVLPDGYLTPGIVLDALSRAASGGVGASAARTVSSLAPRE